MAKKLMSLQLSSLIIGLIAIISFTTVYSLVESFGWVEHTHQTIYQVTRIKDDITECQISVREAIFSNNKSFLNNYYNKSPGIENQLDNLQWLTRNDIVQQKNIYGLRQNVNRRLEAFRDQVTLFNDGKVDEARKSLTEKFGESWINSTRNLSEIIEAEENKLLELRLRDYRWKSSMAMYAIPIMLILYIIFFKVSTKGLTRDF